MFEMRYTIIDEQGTISLVGPGHIVKMLAAGCASGATTIADLLAHVRKLDRAFVERVHDELAVYDEHHLPGGAGTAEVVPTEPPAVPTTGEGDRLPPTFRVTDAAARQRSLQPYKAGLVIFNLAERRIVQVHNTYADIEREGRGRLRRNGRPVQTFYSYTLPDEWRIVP